MNLIIMVITIQSFRAYGHKQICKSIVTVTVFCLAVLTDFFEDLVHAFISVDVEADHELREDLDME